MTYRVELARRAERDFIQLFEAIDAENSSAARNWYAGLRRAVLSLERLPERCPVTEENPASRHLLYGRKPNVYRIIFTIVSREKRVVILHIRHGARRQFSEVETD
ncbi:MAG: type II toxin-antitoxin system RelE/ParE family toxin [Terracidiphilus sp.]